MAHCWSRAAAFTILQKLMISLNSTVKALSSCPVKFDYAHSSTTQTKIPVIGSNSSSMVLSVLELGLTIMIVYVQHINFSNLPLFLTP